MKVKRWLLLITGLLVMIAACEGEPTPIRIFVTATPLPETDVTHATDNLMPHKASEQADSEAAAFPGPSATPALASPTSTPSPPSPATPTPEPATDTPVPPALPDVPQPEQLPLLTQSRMGIQIHPLIEEDLWYQMMIHVDTLGLDWVKIQLPWELLESGPGQPTDLYYAYVQRVQWTNFIGNRRRLVVLSVVGAPDWARPPGANLSLEGPPTDLNELARFITGFIQATGAQDHRIAAIEIWNEPNLEREWSDASMDGATYMTYFGPAYNAIKAIDPQIIVVTAGLAPVGDGVPGATGDRTFLRQMYAAGLAQYTDVKIGVHPYGWGNPPDERCCTAERGWADNPVFFFQDTLYDYRDIMQQNGHNTQLWITEFGWGTYQGVGVNGADVSPVPDQAQFFTLITPEQQAQHILRAFEIVQQPPLGDIVEVAIMWNLNFAAMPLILDQRLEQAGYSLLNASGHPRLAYYYLQQSRRQP